MSVLVQHLHVLCVCVWRGGCNACWRSSLLFFVFKSICVRLISCAPIHRVPSADGVEINDPNCFSQMNKFLATVLVYSFEMLARGCTERSNLCNKMELCYYGQQLSVINVYNPY